MKNLKLVIFPLYVALNMLVCAIVFFPWALSRESVSGLLGRWLVDGSCWQVNIAYILSAPIDRWHEKDHCRNTYAYEKAMRVALYGTPYHPPS
jgi:hypothetical protein